MVPIRYHIYMEIFLKISNILTRINVYAARFAAVLLLLLTFVIMYDVIGRRFFSTGSIILQELEWHIHGVIAMFAIGYAYTRNAHVRIDVFAHHMPDRFKLWFEIFAIVLLLIPFLSLVAYYGYEFAERAFVRGEGANGGRGLPHRWIIKSVVPMGAVLIIMAATSVALRCLIVLKRPDLLTDPFVKDGLWKP